MGLIATLNHAIGDKMKLPNSYGSVFKLKGNRRNPWVARKTVGWKLTDNGKAFPEYLYVGYYKTKVEAMQALSEYNGNPYSKEVQYITFGEVYEQYSKEHFPQLKPTTVGSYRQMFGKTIELHDMPIREIKLADLQNVINQIESYQQQDKTKWCIKAVFEFAIRKEILPPDRKDMVSYIAMTKPKDEHHREPFTEDMIQSFWDNPNFENKILLILVYTGVRIMELLDLKVENVHINERYFDVVESKTKAGIRKVPICDKILPLFKEFAVGEYLINSAHAPHFSYQTYIKTYWHVPNFTPHATRYTFISRCVEKGIDQRIIKKIVGHSGDMTENIYTHISVETLLEAVNKL